MQCQTIRDVAAGSPLARALGAAICLLALAGCPGGEVLRAPADSAPLQRAERLAHAGDHRGSAQAYEQAASGADGEARAQALVRAEREWLLVPSVADAQRVEALAAALGNVDPAGATGVSRTLASAEVALAAGQPDRALQAVRALGDGPPGSEAEVLLLRARAQFALGRAFEGVRSLSSRERFVPAAQVPEDRRVLWDLLRGAAARGATLTFPRGTDPATAGWLDAARVATQGRRNPSATRSQYADWTNRYPSHPASAFLQASMQSDASPPVTVTAQIALLLPLSGRFSDAGEALRDGFLAAYYQQDPAQRPRLKIYDAGDDAGVAYRRALADGAGFVVGPLGKENVQAVTRIADGTVPTLALNFIPDGETVPAHFYQYALAPEDEARQVAERLLASGRRVGVALVPSGEWGTRVLGAFQSALVAGGGTLAASRTFATGTTDYSEPLISILGFDESQRRFRALTAAVGPLVFTPRRRDDLQFVFLAGQPVQGRLVRSQLKFHYAGDLPVYSISDIYEPNPIANQDLEGVSFTDIPWMIDEDRSVADLRNAVQQLWPANARRRGRLFAMGFDAWRLVGLLKDGHGLGADPVPGMTGRLSVDSAGRVRRGLDWAIVGADGQARALPPPGAEN